MYPSPQKTLQFPEKKLTPRGHHLKNLEHPDSSHWEYLNPIRNLKLLERYQPPPPRHQNKENLNVQENEKTSLLVKVSTKLKLPQPL